METLKIKTDLLRKTARMTDDQVGRLFRAMLSYARDEIAPELDGDTPDLYGDSATAWEFVVDDIDAQRPREKAQRENGKKGGRPRKTETQTEPNETQINPNKPNETETVKEKRTKKETVIEERKKSPKGDKERKNDAADLLPIQSEPIWRDFKEMRQRMRKPLTPNAEKLLAEKVDKMADNLADQSAIVAQSIERGWSSFYPLKYDRAAPAGRRGMGINAGYEQHKISDGEFDALFADDLSEVVI